jgi:hypothetical protein
MTARFAKSRVAAVAAAIAAGAAGWLVADSHATSAGSAPPSAASAGALSARQFESGARATPAATVDTALAEAFSVLDRRRSSADALPAVEADGTDLLTEQFGANFSLARRADGFNIGGAWVIPADGYVCLLADPAYTSQASSPTGLEGGSTCQPTLTRLAGMFPSPVVLERAGSTPWPA